MISPSVLLSYKLSYVYDDVANTVTVTDELGRQSRTKWNGLGWKLEEGLFGATGYERRWQAGYDAHGSVLWEEDAVGNRTSYSYDAWSRPVQTTLPDLTTTNVNYLDDVLEVHTTDDLDNVIIETADKFGRIIRTEEQPAGGSRTVVSQQGYAPVSGMLSWQKNGKGEQTDYAYDESGRLIAVTNAERETTQYRYDQLGNHVKTIFPDGKDAVKVYDELGRLIENIDPMGKKDIYYYDANGNRSKLIDKANQMFTYEYTDRNWLKQKIGPAETITFGYHPDGSRAWMTDATGTTSYAYDDYTGQLTVLTYPDGRTIQYTYNSQEQRDSMTTPFGDVVHYEYTPTNRLKTLKWNGDTQAAYDYYSNGLLKQTELGEVVESSYDYTGGRLTELAHSGLLGHLSQTYGYAYDLNANITAIEEMDGGEVTRDQTLTYDKLDRVKTSSQFNETYSYDERGNRLTLQSDEGFRLPENTGFAWDEWDRLTRVTRSDSSQVTYRYNGDNLLTERTEDGVTTRYYYDGQQIIAEGIVQSDGTAVEKVSYLRGHTHVMLEEANGTKGYYTLNGHGDVTSIVGEDGQVLNAYDYDTWGNVLRETEEVANSFRYSGELWDATTDLQYLRARWYDPSIGRFLNEDTYEGNLINPLSLNLYTYVDNNPLIYIDPSGHVKTTTYLEIEWMLNLNYESTAS